MPHFASHTSLASAFQSRISQIEALVKLRRAKTNADRLQAVGELVATSTQEDRNKLGEFLTKDSTLNLFRKMPNVDDKFVDKVAASGRLIATLRDDQAASIAQLTESLTDSQKQIINDMTSFTPSRGRKDLGLDVLASLRPEQTKLLKTFAKGVDDTQLKHISDASGMNVDVLKFLRDAL